MGEGKATFPLGMLLPKRASLIGTVLRSRPLEQKIDANQRFVRELLPRFDDGALRPVIDSRFALKPGNSHPSAPMERFASGTYRSPLSH